MLKKGTKYLKKNEFLPNSVTSITIYQIQEAEYY